jgi:hypothetical protein
MANLKLYQIPRSVLAKEPKPIAQIDFLESLPDLGFDRKRLETQEMLPLIAAIADLIATKLGYAARTNYGVVSVFDPNAMSEYEKLLEACRMEVGKEPTADAVADDKKKKRKK